jgi:hypothetical protein
LERLPNGPVALETKWALPAAQTNTLHIY